jgi:HD-like signal output (HDOD) protein
MMRTYNEGESSIRAESEVFGYTHTEVGSLITARWNYPKVISSIIHQHHRDEETRPPMDDPGTLKVLACVDLSNTICKLLGAGYREPRESIDLVDHPALSFLDIPTGSASELVTELQQSFAKEAAYWVH